MREYALRRLVTMVPVLFIISIISFSLLFLLPGDPALTMLGEDVGDEETYQNLRKELGLDEPIWVQYGYWLGRTLQGDLGTSIRTREPVSDILLSRLPVTLYYGFAGLALGATLGITVAVISALKPGSKIDAFGTLLAMGGVAIPSFWLALLLMYVFSLMLGWLPPSGYISPFKDPTASAKLLIMPAIVLGTGSSAVIMRQGRSALLEVLAQDYITTARSRGLSERLVVWRHALKNAMVPVITILGLQIGNLVNGAVITETVFGIPGVGRTTVDAIFFRDFPVLQGAVLMLTIAVLLANLLTDLAYGYVDPRIRYR
ncbi:MAG TPA: ABC transporter permease [Thermomicrobiales bacterium]|nr:ABC transporter permease [Thermomicrobiales bacterium]